MEENQCTEETFNCFQTKFLNTNMDRMGVKFKLINNAALKPNRANEIFKIHIAPPIFVEATDVVEVIVELNDEFFIRLDPTQQEIVAEKVWAKIFVHPETGVVKKEQEDIKEFSLMLKKYGIEKFEELNLTIGQIREKLKEEGIL